MANTNNGFVASYGRRPCLDLEVINDAGENLIRLTSSKESFSDTELLVFHFKQKNEYFFEKLEKKILSGFTLRTLYIKI